MRAASGTAARWVVLVGVAVAVAVVALGAVLAVTALRLRDEQLAQTSVYGASRQTAADLLGDFVDEETGLRGYIITDQQVFLAPYDAAQARIGSRLTQLRALSARIPGAPADLTQVEAAHAAWLGYAGQQQDRVRQGDRTGATTVGATGAGKQLFDTLRARMSDLSVTLTRSAQRSASTVGDLQRLLVAELVLALIVLVAVVIAGIQLLLRGLVGPMHALASAARAVANGDLSAPIPSAGVTEVREMAADVQAMRDRLLADRGSAQAALESVMQDSPAVAALRAALAPQVGHVPGLQVAARIDPAEGLLAGDWYDLVPVTQHRLAVVLGDVSGHGPASAVLALRLKHALVAALRAGSGPAEALESTSRSLVDVAPELFATVLVVVVDTSVDRLTYANAGHPAALLLERPLPAGERLHPHERLSHHGTGTGSPVTWLDLPSTGPLLSPVVAGWSWAQADHRFEAGDTLIAFTDGLTEARSPSGEQFGWERLVAVIAETGVEHGDRLLDSLSAAAQRHTGGRPRRDDQTLLYARRAGVTGVPVPEPSRPA